jgi:hypothetical protein
MLAALKRHFLVILFWALLFVALGNFYIRSAQRDASALAEHTVWLIVPDGQNTADPAVTVWLDAAREEGIAMRAISDADFITRPPEGDRRGAAILPDTIHRAIAPMMVNRLEQFVDRGGQLMVAYDGGVALGSSPLASRRFAPLSRLVGVNYGPDTRNFGDAGVESGPLFVSQAGQGLLQLPPGKTMRLSAPGAEALLGGAVYAISGYQYGPLIYPALPTSGAYGGTPLIATQSGNLAAGYRRAGKGGVLFVNTPIGDFKGRTDGILLHSFLHLLVFDHLGMPVLKGTPGGIGSLVFNWHIDSRASIPEFEKLQGYGLLDQGPYSLHMTAGPDLDAFGDGEGLDVDHDLEARKWLLRLRDLGYAMGDHGGWIHNWFGTTVNDANKDEMVRYLEMNEKSVSALTGKPSREYSAPVGNQPEWVTEWLEEHGFVAYYFTGNVGMAPTRSYREGVLKTRRIWSFPVLILDGLAAYEEFGHYGDINQEVRLDYGHIKLDVFSEEKVTGWLKSIADFAADTGTVRTFYTHAHGLYLYPNALRELMAHTRALQAAGRFRWSTMSAVADFLNRREQAVWSYAGDGDRLTLKASHPTDLADLTWEVPKAGDQPPRVTQGEGRVEDIGRAWRVVAGPGREFAFEFTRKAMP